MSETVVYDVDAVGPDGVADFSRMTIKEMFAELGLSLADAKEFANACFETVPKGERTPENLMQAMATKMREYNRGLMTKELEPGVYHCEDCGALCATEVPEEPPIVCEDCVEARQTEQQEESP